MVAAIGLRVRENADSGPSSPQERRGVDRGAPRRRSASTADVDLSAYAKAAESVTGVAVIPVSVAQLRISLGAYALSDDGEVVESGARRRGGVVPLAHTEGGLTASVQRGAKAAELSGGFRTHVVADRITRASCFVCRDAGDALTLARWIEDRVDDARGVPARRPTSPSCRATPCCAR